MNRKQCNKQILENMLFIYVFNLQVLIGI